MTEKGEIVTFKGNINPDLDGIFAYNQNVGISCSIDLDAPDRLEIKMHHPGNQMVEVYQMVFVLKGHVQFKNRTNSSDYNPISANQHNLYRVMPGGSSMMINKRTDEVMWINLDQNFIYRYLPYSHPVRKQMAKKRETEALIKLFSKNMPITPQINAILQQLVCISSGDFCNQLLMESKTIELLALQFSQYEHLHNGNILCQLEADKRERMEKAREIIITNTEKRLSLRTLAHMVGTNEFDLKRNFKIVFGNTVYGYLKDYKMEQAKLMLINEAMTIGEISKKVGFSHATHFTSAFKKHFGYLPNKLRVGKLR